MILILRQVNAMDETFELGYFLGTWQILLENPFDLNAFLFHMKYGRKITNLLIFTTPAKDCIKPGNDFTLFQNWS